MCLAIKQMREESEAIGMEKGKAVGRLIKLFELVEEGLLTLTQAANAKLTEEQFKAEMSKAGF